MSDPWPRGTESFAFFSALLSPVDADGESVSVFDFFLPFSLSSVPLWGEREARGERKSLPSLPHHLPLLLLLSSSLCQYECYVPVSALDTQNAKRRANSEESGDSEATDADEELMRMPDEKVGTSNKGRERTLTELLCLSLNEESALPLPLGDTNTNRETANTWTREQIAVDCRFLSLFLSVDLYFAL